MKNTIKKNSITLALLVFFIGFQTSEAQFLKRLQKNTNKTSKQVAPQEKEQPVTNAETVTNEEEPAANIKVWSKYNFVPGDEIIFEDDLANEENGEFPSRWDLLKGNAENASLSQQNVINFNNSQKFLP